MRHLDLFSGIGGFALAASRVWPEHEVVSFCEIDTFASKVLNKYWPETPINADIFSLKGNDYGRIDILTGGFPCQPFSIAGARKGSGDSRHLWPEMLRVIQEATPRWVIAENVTGLLTIEQGTIFDEVLTGLENAGYEVWPFIIPACAVNAPHRRDRVWIIANATGSDGREITNIFEQPGCYGNGGFAANTYSQRQQELNTPTERTESGFHAGFPNQEWASWPTQSPVCGGDDGVPCGMDRNKRLKALGNAIVPQVAQVLMEGIRCVDEAYKRSFSIPA